MLNLNVLKYIFYHSLCRGIAMYAIVGMWLCIYAKSELLQKAWLVGCFDSLRPINNLSII